MSQSRQWKMTRIFWVLGPPWIFLPSLGFLECVFWQRTASPGIHHETENTGPYTTPPISRLQLQDAPIYICLPWEKLLFGLEDGKNWCFHVPLSVRACPSVSQGMQKEQLVVLQEESAWSGRQEVQGGPGSLRSRRWQRGLEEGIFAVPVQADYLPLWILPCLGAEELFREGWGACGDSLRFSVSKYLVSKNHCPLSGDLSPFQKKGLLGPLGGLLASDIKLAICSHLETVFGIAE